MTTHRCVNFLKLQFVVMAAYRNQAENRSQDRCTVYIE